MNKELQSIINNLQRVNSGQPWFGRPVFALLEDIDAAKAFINPEGHIHSAADLLYHMITWADFSLHRIKGDKEKDMAAFEELDWRKIDPRIHTWPGGIGQFKAIHEEIVRELETKDDGFLSGIVDYRNYNFRFLLNGLIQHNIYHIGQIAYVKKLLG